jgi:eukaryotic translation initiation factor 2C
MGLWSRLKKPNITYYHSQGFSEFLLLSWSRLEYPDIPCLNVGTPRKPVFVPAEVCQIKGGQRRLKLDERQTAEMIKTSAQKPMDCVAQLEKSVKDQARLPADPTIAAFNMKVAPEMTKVRQPTVPCHKPFQF